MKKVVFDPEKAIRYSARDGTVFFVNANERRIQTLDGEVAIEFRRHGSMGRHQTIYLVFDEKCIKISGPDDENLVVSAKVVEGAEPPVQFSKVINGLYRDGDMFTSFEQQERLINLLVDMLSSFTNNWVGAAHGRKHHAKVSLSKTFQRKLKGGVYIGI